MPQLTLASGLVVTVVSGSDPAALHARLSAEHRGWSIVADRIGWTAARANGQVARCVRSVAPCAALTNLQAAVAAIEAIL